MTDLTGKAIVVTGAGARAGAGVGMGVLRQRVAAGADVTCFEVNPETQPAIHAAGGRFVQVDVSDPEALAEAQRCDGLVINAGITIQKPLAQLSIDEMDQLWAINQRSVLLLIKLLAAKLAVSGKVAILNLASNHAKASAQDYEAYAGTKGAIVAMTRALAWSLGPQNIRVNALGLTEVVAKVADDQQRLMQTFNSWRATGWVNSVDEIGAVAAFLLSDASSAINGSEIVADQGMSARLGGLS